MFSVSKMFGTVQSGKGGKQKVNCNERINTFADKEETVIRQSRNLNLPNVIQSDHILSKILPCSYQSVAQEHLHLSCKNYTGKIFIRHLNALKCTNIFRVVHCKRYCLLIGASLRETTAVQKRNACTEWQSVCILKYRYCPLRTPYLS